MEKESHLKKSFSDSNLLKENSRCGRSLRKMKNEERNDYDQQKKSSKFDDYKLSSLKHPSLQSKSQILLVNSIPRSEKSNFAQMVSKVGLESKVSEKMEFKRKYPHSSYEKDRNGNNISSDYEAIKRMQAEASVVKLLVDSKKDEQARQQERAPLIFENNKAEVSDEESSLSNMIKKSGEIFLDKKKSKIKFNRADREYNFTGTFNFTSSTQRKGESKMHLTPNESSLMYGNRCKVTFDRSKLSKISSGKQTPHHNVQDIESVRSE